MREKANQQNGQDAVAVVRTNSYCQEVVVGHVQHKYS